MSLLSLPDELLLLIRSHLPLTLLAHLVLSHTCRRFLHLSTESSWRALLFRLRFGRPLCNTTGRRLGWRELVLVLIRHGKGCQRAGCKGTSGLSFLDPFRFHPLHFTVHGHPQSMSHDGPHAHTHTAPPAASTGTPGSGTADLPIPESAQAHAPAYSLTLPRVLQAHLPFPSYPGRTPSSLHTLALHGATQRYAPLCHHPNASCVLATWPAAKELRLPFRILGERLEVTVRNEEGVTLLDLSRALVDALLAEPDDEVYNTVMETYGARDDVVSFGLVQALRDRGFMNDHEWPLIQLLDEYDYGDTTWEGYRAWVDNVRGH
ncbi:hypothetical protein CALVIDRAFT_405548 [Calocera viscosa TUFC12733]|uniref:F-box domain-containing protein n=1 Tax=Calocera viscosa (strain TUFC12733) TaxID=1330018 RepID=A0A167PX85_CALVF|nr:hypothetical protein CALVIDRAFT_405548 [Calocera viscosa TUFC12733]